MDSIDHDLRTRDEVLEELKAHLLRAQTKMKTLADAKRTDVVFNPGDLVFVKLQPYKQISARQGLYSKLAKRYYGPFPIIRRVGTVAYELQLPDHAKIHNVFHVSVLKLAQGQQQISLDLPTDMFNQHPLVEPLAILRTQDVFRHDHSVPQILVQWKGLLPEDASWEDRDKFISLYPRVST